MVFEENNINSNTNPDTDSTSSCDSYSCLLQDVEDPGNTVKEEWEAIERTLYQEKGKQINNPALLKECRLWNETFPHLRIRGTQFENTRAKCHEKGVGPENSVTKCVQTSNAQPGWVKLNEQRECIKKQVVDQLVQRLITKFSLSKDNPTGALQYFDKVVLDNKLGRNEKKSNSNVPTSTEKLEMECYFERGKLQEKISANQNKQLENKKKESNLKLKDYSDLSDSLEKEFNVRFLRNSMIDEKNNLLRSLKTPGTNFLKRDLICEKQEGNLQPYGLKKEGILKKEKKAPKITETIKENKPKVDQLPSPTDSLSSLAKPFEATKKIYKKYEVLLESILKNKGLNFPEANQRDESPKSEIKSYKESVGKLRVNTNYDDYLKRHKQLPKINNFTNNWISRTDNYSNKEFNTAMSEIKKEQPMKPTEVSISSNILQVPRNNWVSNSKSSADINKKSCVKFSKSNRSIKNDFDMDDIKVDRPKLFIRSNKNVAPQTYKSSSCGDLHKRKPEFLNGGKNMKSGGETKNSSRLNVDRGKNTSKTNLKRDLNLPPIETGIIITELNTRPKMPTRIQPRKYT